MNKTDTSPSRELLEIRKALELADEKRLAPGLTTSQKKELEQASIILRNRERELISQIGKEITESIKNSSAQLEILAKKIRARTQKMSKTTQSLNQVKKALQLISKLPT